MARLEKERIEFDSTASGSVFISKQQINEAGIKKQFAKVQNLAADAMREGLATTYVETQSVNQRRLRF